MTNEAKVHEFLLNKASQTRLILWFSCGNIYIFVHIFLHIQQGIQVNVGF